MNKMLANSPEALWNCIKIKPIHTPMLKPITPVYKNINLI